jgi:uncharacterized protein (DUF1697 family)
MVRSVAFIRNVMVGRQGLTRDVLLRIFLDAGAHEPVSHLATGNVSFDLAEHPRQLQAAVEQGIERVTGHGEPVFIRTIAELRRQIARDPFADPPIDDVYERCVTFTAQPVKRLTLPMTNPRGDAVVFAVNGREVYSVTRLLNGRAGTPSKLLERALGRPFSNRNWNTVERIVRKHDAA